MKKITILFFIISRLSFAQTTNIPDISFEDALIQAGIDTSDPMGFSDGFIYDSDAASVQFLDVSNSFITDLTGIESFTSLTWLDISYNGSGALNPLATVDLTNNLTLETIVCTNSYISDLFLGQNTTLQTLNCSDNNISNLDILDAINLQLINAENNSLVSLDLSQHQYLLQVTLQNNQLTLLNVRNTANSSLTTFNASNNAGLLCIDVDNEVNATQGNGSYSAWQKDTSTIYSNNCSTLNVDNFNIDEVKLKVYPNPIVNTFKVECSFEITAVEIYSLNGKKIKRFQGTQESYSINQFQNGMYFVKIFSDNNIITKKLIKQ